MNWKLRFKNKTTLTALIGAVFLFVKQISEIFGFDISGQLEQLSGSIGALLTILVSLGIVVDSTTKGVKDSGITQTYTKPRDENVDPVEYQKVVSDDAITPERQELTPTEFDTSEPFTDDTDEVEFDVADYDYDEELKRGASRYHDDEVLKESEEDGR
ncbi:phage holin [Staphylococcus pettenkoferi]|uniref:Phage holin n=2 Tax=Staphylococcus pettenkoferi TaxID=170573 RepID=A0A9Q4D7C8_9STAP|nr:phage holin [Staphylococcus pettenkoferi]MCY1587624.1 phage holin [Staphylococcus pettenkoferi]MCY1595474.1 phage holin [Staphylococcus pettenkoferi]